MLICPVVFWCVRCCTDLCESNIKWSNNKWSNIWYVAVKLRWVLLLKHVRPISWEKEKKICLYMIVFKLFFGLFSFWDKADCLSLKCMA